MECRLDCWHVSVPGIGSGQRYGYSVDSGPVLLDPYARLVTDDLLSVVVAEPFDWSDDCQPRVPWERSVINELHVRGFTMLHPHVPKCLRGTFLGLSSAPVIEYLTRLGVTAVELLPIQAHLDEPALVKRGLKNFWGYNTLGFFALDRRFVSSPDLFAPIVEFKTMVRELHRAGIEVILDIVFNHTAEGQQGEPPLSFRGIDDAAYYLRDRSGDYLNASGCGNTLRAKHPAVRRLILDCLRYWVTEMHVDGFRFDLASALARTEEGIELQESVITDICEDPLLTSVKLIAEPWDALPDGYAAGRFPPPFREWNDQYRDVVRRFWRGDEGMAGVFATRISGNSDLFHARGPLASINFITAHDGFTLNDLVSYAERHNEGNGEENRDGHSTNYSLNYGVEGVTEDAEILELRERHMKNLLATLFLSSGVPMLLAGDEAFRTQQGNNNAYCHDSSLTWVPWGESGSELLRNLIASLCGVRERFPLFGRDEFFIAENLSWMKEDGVLMHSEDWAEPNRRTLGARFSVEGTPELLAIFHAGSLPVSFQLPGAKWQKVLCTAEPAEEIVFEGESARVPARSVVLLERVDSRR